MKFTPLEQEGAPAKATFTPLTFTPLEETKAKPPETFVSQVAPPAEPVADNIDPTTGKPYPEARALPEKTFWEKLMGSSEEQTQVEKARASNEAMARRIAAERGVPVSRIYKEAGGARPVFNPEGRETKPAVIDAATAATKSLTRTKEVDLPLFGKTDTPEVILSAANTALRSFRGGDIPVKNKSWLDEAITGSKLEPKKGDANVAAFDNVGQNLGYSLTTMVSSAITGALTSMFAGPVAGVGAGMATSGTVSYRASKDEFLSRIKEKLDKESEKVFERPLDAKEWEKAKEEFDSVATKYAAWEAIPEAVSNAIMLKAFTAPLKAINSADKLFKTTARATVSQASEQVSETITGAGQNPAELKAGLTKEELSLSDAFRQQFAATLITTGIMQGGAKSVQYANQFYENYVEPKVRPDSALAKAIKADLEAYAAQPPTQQVRPGEVPAEYRPAKAGAKRPELTELEAARKPELEGEAAAAPLTELEAARKPELEVAQPTGPLAQLEGARKEEIEQAPAIPVEDPRVATQAAYYTAQGFAEDDALLLAIQDIETATGEKVGQPTGRAMQRGDAADEQRTAEGKAERAALSMEETNVPTEIPARVTESIPDQFGNEVPSRDERTASRAEDPFTRGLDNAADLARRSTGREERERTSLEANQKRIQSQVSQAFNREAYPDLGILLGANWTRKVLSRNPTPEEYQDAAYARMEELGGRLPEDAQQAKETPRVTEAPKAVEAKEERPQAPAAAPAVTEEQTKEAAAIARSNFNSAIDNQKEYKSLRDAFDGALANTITTLNEQGLKDDNLHNIAEKEFNALVKKHNEQKETKETKEQKQEAVWKGVKRTTRGNAEDVPTKSLDNVPQRNKADTTTDAYKKLKASIAKTGIVDPITLARSPQTGALEIFEGNHRLQAARELGIDNVPVVLHERTSPSETTPIYGRTPSSELKAVAKPAEVKETKPTEQKPAKPAAEPAPLEMQRTRKEKLEAETPIPAQPATAVKGFAPLELEAARNENIEVEPPVVTAITKSEAALPKVPKTRGPGGGRKVSEKSKTQEQRTKDTNAINKFNREALDLRKAAAKYQKPTGAFPSEKEYDYAEASRLRILDSFRRKLYALSLVRDPKVGYIVAKSYIRGLKPAELDRVKALHEGTVELTKLPAVPEGMTWVANKDKIDGLLVPTTNILNRYESLWDSKAEERRAGTITKEELFELAKRSASNAYGNKIEKFRKGETEVSKPRGRPKKTEAAAIEPTVGFGEDANPAGKIGPRPPDRTPEEFEEFLEPKRVNEAPAKALHLRVAELEKELTKVSGVTQEELGETQGDLHGVIEEELDEDDKALLAEHYGRDSFDKKAKSEFIADIQLAMREGLDAVSRALHDIIKRIQAGVLAAVIVMNPAYMTKPMALAVPMYETRTVQVRAEVPAEAAAKMSEGAKTAYSVIYPAMEQKLKEKNKNFVITDKPTATVFIFDPNGKLVLDSKVLLGLQEGDYFKGKNNIPTNRITPAGGYTLALRDAARGVTDNGGDEKRTAGEYDFGKVFVLDKAIEGKASVTLFHSVWTKEKDAKQRLAALEKPGAADSRYSFGCINAPKPVYKYLLDTQQDRMDGALVFVVPENPANTMDFINGKATASKDLTRIKIEPLTKEVKERIPTTPGEKKVERPSEGMVREGPPAPTIPSTQIAAAKAARRRKFPNLPDSDLYRISQQFDMGSDPAIEKASTLIEALKHVEQSDRDIQSIMASILLSPANMPALQDVDLVVVEKNTKGLPQDVKAEMQKGSAVGLTVPETVGGVVYLRGKSYGENNQGVNFETVLHEAFHAIGLKKIAYAVLAKQYGFTVDPKLEKAVAELEDLMARAAPIARESYKAGNTQLENLIRHGAFTDVHEFYAYGMTDPVMKQFLLNEVPGDKTQSSGFANFINALMHLFGIDPKVKSGLKDLVLASHDLMEAAHPEGKALRGLANLNAIALSSLAKPMAEKIKTQESETKRVMENLAAAEAGSKKLGALGDAIAVARDPRIAGDILQAGWDNMSIPALQAWLLTMPTDVIVSVGTDAGIGSMKQTYKDIREVGAFRRRESARVENIAKPWIKLSTKEQNKLADVMLASTDLRVDPSKDQSNPTLNKMWNALTPQAQSIYPKARDYYSTAFKLFNALAMQRIEQSKLKGTIDDPTTAKGRVAQAIKDTYKAGMSIEPYFPLMREGQYWVSFGKKGNYEIQTFLTPGARTRFIRERIRENTAKGDSRTFEQLMLDEQADLGNDIKELQEKASAASPMLKKLFDSVDQMAEDDMSIIGKEGLKADIFQMHLMSLPEGTFRKQFIRRKNTRGYGRDALKNFVVSGSRIAGQLARAKYAPKIENGISAARASIKGMPDKDRLGMFIRELELRGKDMVNPPNEEGFFSAAVRFANKFIFAYTTTSIKTAVNNTFSFATNAVPTMAKYYGMDATLLEMGKFAGTAAVQVGVTKVKLDGSVTYTWPSLGSSKVVNRDENLQKAVRRMEELDIVKQNQTFDVYVAKKGAAASKAGLAYDAFIRFTGMPFQGTERIVREVTFLTAFKLGMKQGLDFEAAIDKATMVTDEALFNYDPENMPRAMRNPGVKVLSTLKRFSYFTAIYHLRNAAQMIKPLKGETRRGAAYALFGSMGMTGLVGAGVYQAFGVSTVVGLYGMLQGLWNMINGDGDEDDREDGLLKDLNFQRWFNSVYLPENYGDVEFAGVKLSDVLASGLLTATTGYDFASGLSQGSLWFKDSPGASGADNAYMNFVESIGFPILSVPTNIASGFKDINEGDTLKGWEKLNPSALTRNPAVAYRYSQEGVLTGMLDTIKHKDEFTSMQLFMQGLGYKTAGLAETQNMNFVIKREMARVENVKQDLLKQYYKAEKRGNDDMLDKLDKQIKRFNSMYPADELSITSETLDNYIESQDEALLESKRGLEIKEKFQDFDVLRYKGLEQMSEEAK